MSTENTVPELPEKTVGERMIQGAKEAVAYAQGDKSMGTEHRIRVYYPDVKAIRAREGLTQAAFAQKYGFSVGALRDWEQGRKWPTGAARCFLLVLEKEPEVVARVLETA